ncbi:hypothetical protein [Flavihumibacter petaseus]|nr:hypothetical protein [Flavihumibacter petaseus]
MLRNYRTLVVFVLVVLAACSTKKKDMKDGDSVELSDFIAFFPEQDLPIQITDSGLTRKISDSLRIGNKVFSQFVPDSVLRPVFGKGVKPSCYPIGKISVKDGETYLFLRSVSGTKKAATLLVFDKDSFVTSLPLITLNGAPRGNEKLVANMDTRYTVTTLRQVIGPTGQTAYAKKVYVYNPEGLFTLILTESNDQNAAPPPLINPIDTMKAAHKWAGDYLQDKRNIVSFRDGRKTGTLQFFIHFEKDNGQCKGELKGDATITGANTVRFIENNGTCALDFQFSGNTVRIKEQQGCGSYRDIKCFFEGQYTRKKKPSPAPTRKKK